MKTASNTGKLTRARALRIACVPRSLLAGKGLRPFRLRPLALVFLSGRRAPFVQTYRQFLTLVSNPLSLLLKPMLNFHTAIAHSSLLLPSPLAGEARMTVMPQRKSPSIPLLQRGKLGVASQNQQGWEFRHYPETIAQRGRMPYAPTKIVPCRGVWHTPSSLRPEYRKIISWNHLNPLISPATAIQGTQQKHATQSAFSTYACSWLTTHSRQIARNRNRHATSFQEGRMPYAPTADDPGRGVWHTPSSLRPGYRKIISATFATHAVSWLTTHSGRMPYAPTADGLRRGVWHTPSSSPPHTDTTPAHLRSAHNETLHYIHPAASGQATQHGVPANPEETVTRHVRNSTQPPDQRTRQLPPFGTKPAAQAETAVDIDRLADTVMQKLSKQIRIERQRRGLL
ncbi:MAG: hypothetical protein KJ892_03970 [Gammaproteobacteria bacterium]|nr:hypothetical protein [Gammaproteobacteria bacterium]